MRLFKKKTKVKEDVEQGGKGLKDKGLSISKDEKQEGFPDQAANGGKPSGPTQTPAAKGKENNANKPKNTNTAAKGRKRGENIFAAPIVLTENYQTPVYPKSEAAFHFIDGALEAFFLFEALSDKERAMLIDAMMMEEVPKGTEIIKQGETGDYFYVVEEGEVGFAVDGRTVGSTGRGGAFGELALLYDCPRGATCRANTPCRLWKVDQKTFRYMLASNTTSQHKEIFDVLRKVPFLAQLDDHHLLRISDALVSVDFPDKEPIIVKGDVGRVFFIVREGTLKVHDIGFGDSKYVDQHIGPGDYFGERALLTGDPRMASVTATSRCTCLCLSRDKFEEVLGPLQGLIDSAMNKRTLLGVPIFSDSKFEHHELTQLSNLIVETTFKPGTVLAKQGQPLDQKLHIIRSGAIEVASQDGFVEHLTAGDYFGDQTLKDKPGTASKVTITVQKETTCGVLSRRDIISVIGQMKRLGKPQRHKSINKGNVHFKDLIKFRILGVGAFGKVWLVSNKRTGTPYALKMLNKRQIVANGQADGVIREKSILASLDHPFVVDLVATFQDDHSIYMLIGLVQGGELFNIVHTETRDGLPNGNTRFYAACILESLAHMHHRSICYRDLKPENVLIDQKGYCVLVDLGFAKTVAAKTYTLCGTPEYLAPEIILSKGHDKGADYWAFGVLIYEMLVGTTPFYVEGADQAGLFKRIVQEEYSFPDGVVHPQAKDLIQKLIVRQQINRLGCLAGADKDIRDHPWFKIINVEKLLQKQIPVPWIPRLRDPLDATHFDSYSHLENEGSSKQPPLSPVEQAVFKDF